MTSIETYATERPALPSDLDMLSAIDALAHRPRVVYRGLSRPEHAQIVLVAQPFTLDPTQAFPAIVLDRDVRDLVRTQRPDLEEWEIPARPPTCETCARNAGDAMAPRHNPSPLCESGGRPHCTCDRCY